MTDISQYDYHLPKELIAQEPLSRRVDARLLVVDRRRGELQHLHVRDLPELLDAGDCLVVNNTRVVPARLVGRRATTRGRWHGLYLRSDEHGLWLVLSKTRGKLQPGETIVLEDRDSDPAVELAMIAKLPGGVWAASPQSDEETWAILDRVGRVPLPPYIRGGEMLDSDLKNYQTVYASQPGAVAAPTAGLHFTPALLQEIHGRGVGLQTVTLHVGLGTFRPISSENLEEHAMHAEWGELSESAAEALNRTREAGKRIVAIGTTSVRVLETAADAQGRFAAWEGETSLFIRPPYQFRGVDALLTNFHLPKSTLLVLVRTFGGDELIRAAYEAAIQEQYRFYSYGDAMLIL
ncbi:MAG: tRNA preQ1(34) S-adenosylmethionine ribosyltransferase-isomerase QueA [Planctomycetales bacterium]|nr:tRNA preQ1(34) S-adenosylmethionine ribosyltransferase-isomerase QueA [Planctomycetales bacterium]